MRRGQSTLEYIILIGLVAAAIIVMLVYVSRGHQGNLRSQADQLDAGQYAPGKTTIHPDIENKTLSSTTIAGSTTTVKHPDKNDVNEPNTALKTAEASILNEWGYIYQLWDSYESLLPGDGSSGATAARANGLPIPEFANETQRLQALDVAYAVMSDYQDAAKTAKDNWPTRNRNQTSVGTTSTESGTTTSHKEINETLGNL